MKQTTFLFSFALSLLLIAGCSKEDAVSNGAWYAAKWQDNEKVKAVSNKPMPQKPQRPEFPTDEEIQTKIAQNAQYLNSKITQKDGKTIYYFKKGEKNKIVPTDNPKEAQYYRLILGKTAENACVAQNFYINGKKQTEIYAILDDQKCVSEWGMKREDRDYLTFIGYDKQETIERIDNLDRQNRIRYFFAYDEKTKKPHSVVLYNIPQKTSTAFYLNDDFMEIVYTDNNQNTITTFYKKPLTALKVIAIEDKIDLKKQQIQKSTTWLAPDGKKAFEQTELEQDNDKIKTYQLYLDDFSKIEEMLNRQ